MMILIADGGSSKTKWVLLLNENQVFDFETVGVNPYVSSIDEIKAVLNMAHQKLGQYNRIDRLHFYGAGCSNDELIQKVTNAFNSSDLLFDYLEVNHDLLAAARALFGNKKGIACILGTGSNSALYDGFKILDNIPSLGYVLGDEGGGVDIGRRWLIAIYKRKAPKELIDAFFKQYPLSVKDVLHHVHFEERPNKFIASFSLFVKENIDHPYCRSIVESAFEHFIKLNVLGYEDCESYSVSFIGSVATAYADIMMDVLNKNGLKRGEFVQDPSIRLVSFHLSQSS